MPVEAEHELSALRGDNVLPEQANGRGDPFIHGQRLGPQPGAGFAALFGSGFAAALETLPEGTWAGPVESAYGLHLVFIEDSTPPTLPPLAEVETRVREDLLEARSRKILRQSVDELRAHYTVRVEPGP